MTCDLMSSLQWLALVILMAGVTVVQDIIPWSKWYEHLVGPADRCLASLSLKESVHAHYILHTTYYILHTTYYILRTTYYVLHT